MVHSNSTHYVCSRPRAVEHSMKDCVYHRPNIITRPVLYFTVCCFGHVTLDADARVTSHITMTTTTPFATYRSCNFNDDLLHSEGNTAEFTPHSATLLSAHLGLLSSIFGRQTDVLPLERHRRFAEPVVVIVAAGYMTYSHL